MICDSRSNLPKKLMSSGRFNTIYRWCYSGLLFGPPDVVRLWIIVLSANSTCCVTSRHDTCDLTSVSRLQRRACSNMADDEEAVQVYKFSLSCSGFASISRTTSGKIEVDMSTPVHAVATPQNTCRACRVGRASRDGRVAPCCRTSATQHVTTFKKCMGYR